MVSVGTVAAALLALLCLAPPGAGGAGTTRVVELTVPHAASTGEAADLAVQVGVIPKGTQIDITTPSGEFIGTISPFAIRPGLSAGTYIFPLNAGTIQNGRVVVSLSMRRAGEASRAPASDEVTNVSIVFTRIAP